mgnify:CR=1 FL=1
MNLDVYTDLNLKTGSEFNKTLGSVEEKPYTVVPKIPCFDIFAVGLNDFYFNFYVMFTGCDKTVIKEIFQNRYAVSYAISFSIYYIN